MSLYFCSLKHVLKPLLYTHFLISFPKGFQNLGVKKTLIFSTFFCLLYFLTHYSLVYEKLTLCRLLFHMFEIFTKTEQIFFGVFHVRIFYNV